MGLFGNILIVFPQFLHYSEMYIFKNLFLFVKVYFESRCSLVFKARPPLFMITMMTRSAASERNQCSLLSMKKMTSAVTKAMIESYVLMVMVMGTFFIYFCGMVWAFCNPKLSEVEEGECAAGNQAGEPRERRCVCAPGSPQRDVRCAAGLLQVAASPYTAETLTQSTYVNFWEDDDDDDNDDEDDDDDESLLSDSAAFCLDNLGIDNQITNSPSWIAM